MTALASTLEVRTFPPGSVLFHSGDQPPGVWIVRDGRIELSVGSGRRRAVVQLLRPGDMEGISSCCWRCRCPTPAGRCRGCRARRRGGVGERRGREK